MSNTTSAIKDLPIFKHLEAGDLEGGSLDSFRKGEKGLFGFLKWGLIIGLVAAFAVYALPTILLMVGKMIGIAICGLLIVGLFMARKPILKALRRLARGLHAAVIKHDPFGQLEESRAELVKNQSEVARSKGTISKLARDCQVDAKGAQTTAEKLQGELRRLNEKLQDNKKKLNEYQKKLGAKAKQDSAYIKLYTETTSMAREAERKTNEYNQQVRFVQSYGMRGKKMTQMKERITIYEVIMSEKVKDFDSTVQLLKNDYEFAVKARSATSKVRSAMSFEEQWEVELALDVITTKIAEDIAETSLNMREIESITNGLNIDDPEASIDSLENLIGKLDLGELDIPNADDYQNPFHEETIDDQLAAGDFGDIFNNE